MKFIYFLTGIILLQSCEKKSLNEKEILEIIHSNKGYENMNLKKDFFTGDVFIDTLKTFRKILNEENFKPIYEADFNNDGKKDYLVNLAYLKISNENDVIKIHISEDNHSTAFLLSENKGYKLLNPGKSQVYEIITSKIIHIKNQPLIKLICYNKKFDGTNKIFEFGTLTIKNNELVEYTDNIKKHNIEKIVFTQNGGYSPSRIYQLTLTENSTKLHSDYYKNLEGDFSGKHYNEFQKLSKYLNDIDFPKLSARYSDGCCDHSSVETEIVYNNGKSKKIFDYGEKGTLGLVKFYEMIKKIAETENWQKTY
ncbi:hypothetical protein [Chryseobacterium sp.]|uniref:DUF6438 domain-containing protein n=1 Tax=Chryseobacterium sp. TaxID=1871047 RepID=UPI002897DCF7|nr:hypothetical protein [Chryseobacterium sp.]